ncbi:MAG: sigma-54 dependent transcriptional regulator [Fibrobacteraceae bacterium]
METHSVEFLIQNCKYGDNDKMQEMMRLLTIAAKSDIPVLLCGESGTGKEVAARKLHELSPRAPGPFIAVNCGALSAGLVESLFEGACRGAFTGAVCDRVGFVRAADGGTLFLDEIGELPLESQTRLLRILQEKSVTPVGSERSISVNFRLVCATHRDLDESVRAGSFREDLFFRLNVFPVRLPPLRKRPASEFAALLRELWAELSDSPLSADDSALLRDFPWPGNVRQLKNVLCRYHLLGPHGTALSDILVEEPPDPDWAHSGVLNERRAPYRVRAVSPSWDRIRDALAEEKDNKTRAARRLGISRGALCYQVRKMTNRFF